MGRLRVIEFDSSSEFIYHHHKIYNDIYKYNFNSSRSGSFIRRFINRNIFGISLIRCNKVIIDIDGKL